MPTYLLPILMQLIMGLPALIKGAEDAFSGKPGSGAAKKTLVMESTKTVLDVVTTLDKETITKEQSDAILSSIGLLTDATVKVMKTVDLFRKPTAPAATV